MDGVIIDTAVRMSQYLSESCLNIEVVVKIDSTGTENGSVTCTRSEYEGRKLGVTWTKEIDDTDRVCTKQEPQTC